MAVWADGEGTKVVINGGDFTQKITGTDNQYDLVYASGGAQIEINGGSFKVGAGDPKWTLNCRDNCGSVITVKGGKFYKFDPSAPRAGQADEVVVPEDYTVVKVGDWYEVVKKEVGKTFTEGTHTLSDGITANMPDAIAVKASGTDTTVTITGGAFDGGAGGNNQCVQARDGATVVIKGGTFTVGGDANGYGNSVIESQGGHIVIEGGFFKTDYQYGGRYYVLNQLNGNPGTITVTGGTFVNYDPSTGDDNLGGNFVADGYKVVSETKANGEIWYTVVAE